MTLDGIDRRIPRALQRNGLLRNAEVAEEAGLPPPQLGQVYLLLEEAGVIERYVAVLNAAKVGMGLAVFMRLAKGASNTCRKSSSAA